MVSNTETKAITVMIVEEDAGSRGRALSAISHAGFAVVEAKGAGEALDFLGRRNDIDVIVTAVNMSGPLNGLQLAVRIHNTWPDLAIVITSALVTLRQSALPDRCRFLRKPYQATDLIECIKRLSGALSSVPSKAW